MSTEDTSQDLHMPTVHNCVRFIHRRADDIDKRPEKNEQDAMLAGMLRLVAGALYESAASICAAQEAQAELRAIKRDPRYMLVFPAHYLAKLESEAPDDAAQMKRIMQKAGVVFAPERDPKQS